MKTDDEVFNEVDISSNTNFLHIQIYTNPMLIMPHCINS